MTKNTKKTKSTKAGASQWFALWFDREIMERFMKLLNKHDLTAREYFNLLHFNLDEMYEAHELSFIKYYFKRSEAARQIQNSKWNRTRSARLDGKETRHKDNDLMNISVDRDTAIGIRTELEQRFEGIGKFKISMALEYWAVVAKDVIPLLIPNSEAKV